jgi:hypothetical protein
VFAPNILYSFTFNTITHNKKKKKKKGDSTYMSLQAIKPIKRDKIITTIWIEKQNMEHPPVVSALSVSDCLKDKLVSFGSFGI